MPERIRILRKKGWTLPENTIDVSRGTYANPFVYYEHCKGADWGVKDTGRFNTHLGHGFTKKGAADLAMRAYRRALEEIYPDGSTARKLLAARFSGKDVACHCLLDTPCHGDVLLEWAADPAAAELAKRLEELK